MPKIVLEMNHDEAISLLEGLNLAIYENGDTESSIYNVLMTLREHLKKAIKNPQPDKAPELEPEGRLGD